MISSAVPPLIRNRVRLKCRCDGDIRTVILGPDCDFSQLKKRLSQDYGFDVSLKYEDKDGDMITLSSQNDFDDFLLGEPDTVNVVVTESTLPNLSRRVPSRNSTALFPAALSSVATTREHVRPAMTMRGQSNSLVRLTTTSGNRFERFPQIDGYGGIPSNNGEPSIRWKRGEMLGQGAFGVVYLGLNIDTGELMAVKQLAIDEVSKKTLSSLENEIYFLRSLRHPNIVRYIGTEVNPQALSIFLEYVPGGSLKALIDKFGQLEESVAKSYTRQLLLGLEYLHRNGIAHRDIKGANCLVGNDGVIKLADFGNSKHWRTSGDPGAALAGAGIAETYGGGGPPQQSGEIKGTPSWMAPEVIREQGGQISWRKADVWSLACTTLEMTTGKPPWSQFNNSVTILYHIACQETLPEYPNPASMELVTFLNVCFQRDPSRRPDITSLLLHPFVSTVSGGSGWNSAAAMGFTARPSTVSTAPSSVEWDAPMNAGSRAESSRYNSRFQGYSLSSSLSSSTASVGVAAGGGSNGIGTGAEYTVPALDQRGPIPLGAISDGSGGGGGGGGISETLLERRGSNASRTAFSPLSIVLPPEGGPGLGLGLGIFPALEENALGSDFTPRGGLVGAVSPRGSLTSIAASAQSARRRSSHSLLNGMGAASPRPSPRGGVQLSRILDPHINPEIAHEVDASITSVGFGVEATVAGNSSISAAGVASTRGYDFVSPAADTMDGYAIGDLSATEAADNDAVLSDVGGGDISISSRPSQLQQQHQQQRQRSSIAATKKSSGGSGNGGGGGGSSTGMSTGGGAMKRRGKASQGSIGSANSVYRSRAMDRRSQLEVENAASDYASDGEGSITGNINININKGKSGTGTGSSRAQKGRVGKFVNSKGTNSPISHTASNSTVTETAAILATAAGMEAMAPLDSMSSGAAAAVGDTYALPAERVFSKKTYVDRLIEEEAVYRQGVHTNGMKVPQTAHTHDRNTTDMDMGVERVGDRAHEVMTAPASKSKKSAPFHFSSPPIILTSPPSLSALNTLGGSDDGGDSDMFYHSDDMSQVQDEAIDGRYNTQWSSGDEGDCEEVDTDVEEDKDDSAKIHTEMDAAEGDGEGDDDDNTVNSQEIGDGDSIELPCQEARPAMEPMSARAMLQPMNMQSLKCGLDISPRLQLMPLRPIVMRPHPVFASASEGFDTLPMNNSNNSNNNFINSTVTASANRQQQTQTQQKRSGDTQKPSGGGRSKVTQSKPMPARPRADSSVGDLEASDELESSLGIESVTSLDSRSFGVVGHATGQHGSAQNSRGGGGSGGTGNTKQQQQSQRRSRGRVSGVVDQAGENSSSLLESSSSFPALSIAIPSMDQLPSGFSQCAPSPSPTRFGGVNQNSLSVDTDFNASLDQSADSLLQIRGSPLKSLVTPIAPGAGAGAGAGAAGYAVAGMGDVAGPGSGSRSSAASGGSQGMGSLALGPGDRGGAGRVRRGGDKGDRPGALVSVVGVSVSASAAPTSTGMGAAPSMGTEKERAALRPSSLEDSMPAAVSGASGGGGSSSAAAGSIGMKVAASFENEIPVCLDEHTSAITKLRAPARTNLFISSSTDGTVRIWGADDTQSKLVLDATSFSTSSRTEAAPGGGASVDKRSSVGGPGDIGTPKQVKVLNIWAEEGCATVWGACSDGAARVWSGIDGKPLRLLKGHEDSITALEGWSCGSATGGGCIVGTGSADRTIRLWDLRAKRSQVFLFRGHSDSVLALRWSEGGRTVVSASKDKTVRIWDTRAGRLRVTMEKHFGVVNALRVVQDSSSGAASFVSAGRDSMLNMWSDTGDCIATLNAHRGAINFLSEVCYDFEYKPNTLGNPIIISAGNDNAVKLWDLKRMKLVAEINVGVALGAGPPPPAATPVSSGSSLSGSSSSSSFNKAVWAGHSVVTSNASGAVRIYDCPGAIGANACITPSTAGPSFDRPAAAAVAAGSDSGGIGGGGGSRSGGNAMSTEWSGRELAVHSHACTDLLSTENFLVSASKSGQLMRWMRT